MKGERNRWDSQPTARVAGPPAPQRKEAGPRASTTEIRALAPGPSDRGTHGFTVLSAGEPMGPPPFAWWSQFHSCSVGGAFPGATGEKPGDLTSRTSLKGCSPEPPLGRRRGLLITAGSFSLQIPLQSPQFISELVLKLHCAFVHRQISASTLRVWRGGQEPFFFFKSDKPRCF